MANEFNIRKLTAEAHNYVGLPFPALPFNKVDLPNLSRLGRAILGKDLLGRPFFDDFVIDGHRLPNEPLLTITGKKTIVETIVVGSDRKGTVKEFISAEDYSIKIEGVILGNKEYPYIEVDKLVEICEQPAALPIQNDILNLFFRVNNIVIKDYGFGSMKGKPFSQSYYISAVSDEDFYAVRKDGIQSTNLNNLF